MQSQGRHLLRALESSGFNTSIKNDLLMAARLQVE